MGKKKTLEVILSIFKLLINSFELKKYTYEFTKKFMFLNSDLMIGTMMENNLEDGGKIFSFH